MISPTAAAKVANSPTSLGSRRSNSLRNFTLYTVVVASVVGAVVATHLLDTFAPGRPNLFLFFLVTVLSAWFAGPGPGWLSVILSTLAVDIFFLEPLLVLEFSARDIPWLMTFLLCSISANGLSLQRRRAEAQLRQAQSDLEKRVQERTRDLRRTNERLLAATTERVRAENALRESQNELARVARVMTVGEFTASIAHEINQPLAAVVVNGEAALNWARRSPPALSEVTASVAAIVAAGQRAAEVISRVRSLVNKSPPVMIDANINELIGSVVELVQAGFKTAEVETVLGLAPDLPPVRGDRVQLQQLFLNLFNNAVEAMAEISGRPRVLTIVTTRSDGGGVSIAVQDTGQGFAGADETRIFEPFYSTKVHGTGMGLAICQTIVQLHGGRLSVAARAPHGLSFKVELPTRGAVYER